MENYIYIQKVSSTKMIIGYLLCLLGIFSFLMININLGEELIFVWGLLFVAGAYLVSTEGVEINFQENKYRQVFSIFEINLGVWKSYGKIEYISLIEQNVKQNIPGRPFYPHPTIYSLGKMIVINIFDKNNTHKVLYATKDKNLAVEIGKKIQNFYNVDIINHLE